MNKLPPSSSVGVGMSEHTLHTRKLRRAHFSLKCLPLTKQDKMVERSDMIEICQPFSITASYSDAYDASIKKKRIYALRGGVGRMDYYVRRFRFKDYDDFVHQSRRNDMLNFIVKCTNLSPLIFELAFDNPGVAVPFFVDYNKYIDLCGGKTYLFDYEDMEGFKSAMREKFDLIAIRKEQKKLRGDDK